ncbi:HNH endonuclease signature motif containing protein [Variovorax sp. Varisp41]|uniref:HNH endonuclease signature motif containing protein n=1 Tax=Variovorax sp. Varisp41 TaxID=3243033 RepID=UPI0039B6E14D
MSNIPERMERKIVRVPFSGCWIWMGSAGRYGHAHLNGRVVRAHRALFQLAGGTIPDGMELLHSCDIGVCVNPDHLSVGTHQENMSDMVRKGRARAPTGANHWTSSDPERARQVARRNIANAHGSGVCNSNAKASPEIAELIRAAHAANPTQPMEALGKAFGLGRETTRKIVKGISWQS